LEDIEAIRMVSRIKRVRNPCSPETIQQLVYAIVVSYPLWREAIGWLKAWMRFREAREIRIKVDGNELVVKGYMRANQLEKLFQKFQQQIRGARASHLKVTLPKGVKRTFPRELTSTQGRKDQ
jgi:hypothetical protein